MISLKKSQPGTEILHDQAGGYIFNLSDQAGPGRLLADSSWVDIDVFPKLFERIGHIYSSGDFSGDGSEPTGQFRLPGPNGRLLKPVTEDGSPGVITEDTIPPHSHQAVAQSASHGSHTLSNWPRGGRSIGHSYNPDPTERVSQGYTTSASRTSNSAGAHGHTFTVDKAGGAETRPFTFKAPLFIHTGQESDACVAIIHGLDWGVTPGYNEEIPGLTQVVYELSKKNLPGFRIRHHGAASGVSTINTAHKEIERQLKVLKSKYQKVYILAFGTGCHLAARAMTEYNKLHIADKFVGVNGVYDPTLALGAEMTIPLTNYLGGDTPALKTQAKPIKPYYPAKCWHGDAVSQSPLAQVEGWASDIVQVPGMAWGANPVSSGIMPAVIDYLLE